jgi:hypothetical protein
MTNICKINRKQQIITENMKNKIEQLEKKITEMKKKPIIKNYISSNDQIEIIKEQIEPINNQLINIIMEKNKKIEELTNKYIVDNKYIIIDNIKIESRIYDNFINATQLCSINNKQFNDWYNLESTRSLIDIQKISVIDILFDDVWIHPTIALILSNWISYEIGLQIHCWIYNILYNNKILEEKNNEIQLKDQHIKLLQNTYVKKQLRKEYPGTNVIYIVSTEDNMKKRIYIIGKAIDLKNRLSVYNKTVKHDVIYYKECGSEDQLKIVENMVLCKLENYREQANRDRFILPLENNISLFTDVIDNAIKFFRDQKKMSDF